MQILSVNREHTQSIHDVAFNVDCLPVEGALERYNPANITITAANNILRIRVPAGLGNQNPPLNAGAVRNIVRQIANAEAEMAREAEEATKARERMLASVAQLTQYSLSD